MSEQPGQSRRVCPFALAPRGRRVAQPHATKHLHETAHPVIESFDPGEDWAYCYVDDLMGEVADYYPEESPPRRYAPPSASAF